MNVKLYIKNKEGDYVNVPLYNDESINYQSKISDAEDLETVFNDSTNSFTIPASSTTNAVFNYWFEIGVQPSTRRVEVEDNNLVPGVGVGGPNYDIERLDFDIKRKIDSYIEISGVPYKYGVISLLNIEYKNGLPLFYKIEFYGLLTTISADFKEDKLSDLKFLDNLDYTYSIANTLDSITSGGVDWMDNKIVTPLLLATDRNISSGEGSIFSEEGAILEEELRPGIKVTEIIKAIEEEYGIKFESNFFRRSTIERLYMWLNASEDQDNLIGWKPLPMSDDFVIDINEEDTAIQVNHEEGIITFNRDKRIFNRFNYNVTDSTSFTWYNNVGLIIDTISQAPIRVQIRLRDLDTGEIVDATEGWDFPRQEATYLRSFLDFKKGTDNFIDISRYALEYKSREPFVGVVDLRLETGFISQGISPPVGRVIKDMRYNTIKTIDLESKVSIRRNLPDMTVAEFFKGIMNMFRLIIEPIDTNTFKIETIDEYYGSGETIDLTPYIDSRSHGTSVRKVFRKLEFKWEESEQVLQKGFRDNFKRNYGDLSIIDKNLENSKKIELPFTPILPDALYVPTMDNTNYLNIGLMQSLNGSELEVNMEGAFLFYNNGIQNLSTSPIFTKIGGSTESIQYIRRMNIVDSESPSARTTLLSWGEEVLPSEKSVVHKSLYNNFWKSWVDTLYNKDSRLVPFNGYASFPLIDKLKLNSKIIVGNDVYNINDLDINLTTDEFKINLFPNFDLMTDKEVPSQPSSMFFNSGSSYGTIDLLGYEDWEVDVQYRIPQQSGWIHSNNNGDEGLNSFDGRYFNFRVDSNMDVPETYPYAGLTRTATISFTDRSTNETYTIRIYQDGLLD